MKDATFYIETEFYRLLNNNISVPVYNLERPVRSTEKAFVKIASTYQLPQKTKDNFYGEYYLNLDVVTIVPDTAISTKKLGTIVNQVLATICPTPTTHPFIENPDFSVCSCELVGTTKFKDRTDAETQLRHVLEFKIIINQK